MKKKLTRYLVSISAEEFSLKQILVDAVILPQVGLIGSPVHLVFILFYFNFFATHNEIQS